MVFEVMTQTVQVVYAPTVIVDPPEPRRRKGGLVAACAAAFAAALSIMATVLGAGMSPDSTNYVSLGRNIASGNGYRSFDGRSFTAFPPGLAAVIAVGQWLGLGADLTVRLFHAAAFAAAVLLGYLLLRRHLRTRSITIGATVLLAVSVPLLIVAQMIWTEPAFIVICLAFILALEQAVESSAARSWLAAAALLVWAAFMFRYAGIALLAVGVVAIVIARRRSGWRSVVVPAAGFAVLGLVGPLVLMARNHSVDGSLMGPRSPSTESLPYVIRRTIGVIGQWTLPSPVPAMLQRLAGLAMVAGVVGTAVLVVVAHRRRQNQLAASGTSTRVAPVVAVDPIDGAATSPSTISIVPLIAFVVCYFGYLVFAKVTVAFDAVDTRLLAPLYVPIVVLMAIGLERVLGLLAVGRLDRLRSVLIGATVVFVGVQMVGATHTTWVSARDGVGYTARTWQASELAAATRSVPQTAVLYSNVADGLWAVLEREPILGSPAKTAYRSDVQLAFPQEMLEHARCDETYLAWFTSEDRGGYTPAELGAEMRLVVVSELDDGTLYRISALPGAADGAAPCARAVGAAGA